MDVEKVVESKRIRKTDSEAIDGIIAKLKMETYVPCYLTLREREVALKCMEIAKTLISCNDDREVKISWV